MVSCEVAIVGGGVVGCAIARHIALTHPHKKIVVIEKLSSVGLETSKFNSGVLHSGLHQVPGSLKARFAFYGSKKAVAYLDSKDLPMLHTGMLVAISKKGVRDGLWREMRSLGALIRRGYAQDVKFKFLTSYGVRKLEPNLEAFGGIFIPNVWVINPTLFVKALYEDACNRNVHFLFSNKVHKIEESRDSHRLRHVICTAREEIEARILINAAGLYADEIAALADVRKYKLFPWRGEYYEVISEKRNLIKRLVYPAIPANSPGKGIHFSPRVDGRLFLGPNARPVPSKDHYDKDKTPKDEFLAVARSFCPDLTADDLAWGYSGIRPKLSDRVEEDDFIISLDGAYPPIVNLVGIESPGLSSAMAIAEYVSAMLGDCL